jgi:alkylated DNA repair dioxygenase AlkB
MRLKPYKEQGKLVSVLLEPRSLYVISGAARWQFQHSIPAMEKLRYSITFRTLRKPTNLAA